MSISTRRFTPATRSGQFDQRYLPAMYWHVKYLDPKTCDIVEFDHFGPSSVKQELEKRGIPFDFNVEVTPVRR